MFTAADLDERSIWKLDQAGYLVTTQPDHGYRFTNVVGHTIAQSASLDDLCTLADQIYEPV